MADGERGNSAFFGAADMDEGEQSKVMASVLHPSDPIPGTSIWRKRSLSSQVRIYEALEVFCELKTLV